jgi:hypothetical protein
MQWLQGKKTYIVAGLMVAASLIHLLSGDIGFAEFAASEHLNTLLEGVGLGTLRAGVSNNARL